MVTKVMITYFDCLGTLKAATASGCDTAATLTSLHVYYITYTSFTNTFFSSLICTLRTITVTGEQQPERRYQIITLGLRKLAQKTETGMLILLAVTKGNYRVGANLTYERKLNIREGSDGATRVRIRGLDKSKESVIKIDESKLFMSNCKVLRQEGKYERRKVNRKYNRGKEKRKWKMKKRKKNGKPKGKIQKQTKEKENKLKTIIDKVCHSSSVKEIKQ